ncbi:MAG TPA: alpha/beta fold hydrolase, partial [Dongiaceae bacterium]|nr:alpha/beta fold hydrolase [Dongiaceae bacterium]
MNERSFITAGDGYRIAYRFDGQATKPVLVLSNSIATTLEMWDTQITTLTKHFRVLRYDTRGHGTSTAPSGAYSIDRLGRDVIELLDALRIERVHFLGLSLGGMIGQWLGIHAADRIDRLILSNTSSYLGPAPQWDALITSLLEQPDMDAMGRMFLGNWFPPRMFESDLDLIERFRTMIVNTSPVGLAGNFAAVRDMDFRVTSALIERPTLVIGGSNDTVTLPGHSELLAATIPGAQLVILEAVHLPNIERAVEYEKVVMGFLRQTVPG